MGDRKEGSGGINSCALTHNHLNFGITAPLEKCLHSLESSKCKEIPQRQLLSQPRKARAGEAKLAVPCRFRKWKHLDLERGPHPRRDHCAKFHARPLKDAFISSG